MSVVEGKRHQGEHNGKFSGKLEVLDKAHDLAKYTINIASNEDIFPKRYRWCITSKIVECAIDIDYDLTFANSVYVKTKEDYILRNEYQTKAISETSALLSMIDIAYLSFSIDSHIIENWTEIIVKLQSFIRSWNKSDDERYSNIR